MTDKKGNRCPICQMRLKRDKGRRLCICCGWKEKEENGEKKAYKKEKRN